MVGKIYVTWPEAWWPNRALNGFGFLHNTKYEYDFTEAEMREDWTRGIGYTTAVLFA